MTEKIKDGIHTEWYESGEKKDETTYKDGLKNGLSISWYENGRRKIESNFKNGKLDGLGIFWYDNGLKKFETTFKDDKFDGPFIEWYENGQKKKETNFKNDKDNGPKSKWYENGQKKFEGNSYVDGKYNGLVTLWYKNGQKEKEFTWKIGVQEGLYTEWYENGQKQTEGTKKDGEKDGIWIEWYENGDTKFEKIYKNGRIISEKELNEDGSFKEFVLDYSKINSWEDFIKNFDHIKNDLHENINDDKNRISCINVLLESEPQGDFFGRDEKDIFEEKSKYYFKYQQIIKTYIINNMVMLNDIMETEHFNKLSQSERNLFIDFHKNLGNEVMKNMEQY